MLLSPRLAQMINPKFRLYDRVGAKQLKQGDRIGHGFGEAPLPLDEGSIARAPCSGGGQFSVDQVDTLK